MKFRVTEIEFDFNDPDEEFTQDHYDNVTADALGTIWKAEDEDDLVEEITWATGWCVKSLEYVVLPDQEIKLKSGGSVYV